ncbi:MAG: hypothetical protein K9H25_23700 [Rhodospirillum sp.]|nr:hypothetical protein [Rhodospirillum sp.]MCF8492131.1 hypothetical protein [Rhodospirillum sp.]MCF8501048.1 hypothetical protein [Rhodospirillum sp.]
MRGILHTYHSPHSLPLTEAAAFWGQAGLGAGVALLSSPRAHGFARVTGEGHLQPAREFGDDLVHAAFEARLFNGAGELRWRDADGTGTGPAVLLTLAVKDNTAPWVSTRQDLIGQLDSHYLLWGRVVASDNPPPEPEGWITAAAARIGAYSVPLDPDGTAGRFLRITARELLVMDPIHGNVTVFDELLTGVERTDGRPDRTGRASDGTA